MIPERDNNSLYGVTSKAIRGLRRQYNKIKCKPNL